VGLINHDIVLEAVHARNSVIVGIVMGIMGALMTGVVCFTYLVLRPLSKLAKQAELLSEMNVEEVEPLPSSRFREIAVLVRAFNYLMASLKEVRAYLPSHLFASLSHVNVDSAEVFDSSSLSPTAAAPLPVTHEFAASYLSATATSKYKNRSSIGSTNLRTVDVAPSSGDDISDQLEKPGNGRTRSHTLALESALPPHSRTRGSVSSVVCLTE